MFDLITIPRWWIAINLALWGLNTTCWLIVLVSNSR